MPRGTRAVGWVGFNCFMPHKASVIKYLDGLGSSDALMTLSIVSCAAINRQTTSRLWQFGTRRYLVISSAYIFFVANAMARQLNFSTARFRPAWPKRFRSSGSHISTLIFSARARANLSGSSASKGLSVCCSSGTRNPVYPSTTTSLMPPTALPTTGVSQAIASRLMMPKGS